MAKATYIYSQMYYDQKRAEKKASSTSCCCMIAIKTIWHRLWRTDWLRAWNQPIPALNIRNERANQKQTYTRPPKRKKQTSSNCYFMTIMGIKREIRREK